ncbi:hypothetical protein FUAX_36630 [Fulvitalea axinellae]|uniref:DUF4466 domain-containing protein n=1 Tax=Fulvitalea axinellae TaxID=1182444 RepID=A0AAU9DDH2_9BACT|nr:hypothetical protein FUAX_36630 [Fulvitalea axinellae]
MMRKLLAIFLLVSASAFFSCNEQEELRQAIQMNLPTDAPSMVVPGQLIYFNVYPSTNDERKALARLDHVEVYKDGDILYSTLPRVGNGNLGFRFSYVIRSEDLGKRLVFKFNGVLDNNVMASADLGLQVVDSYDKVGYFRQDYDYNNIGKGFYISSSVVLENGIRQVPDNEADFNLYLRISRRLGNSASFASPLPFQLSSIRVTRFINIPDERKGELNFEDSQALAERVVELTEGLSDARSLVDFTSANGQWYVYSTRYSHAGIIRINYLHNVAVGFTVFGLYIKP